MSGPPPEPPQAPDLERHRAELLRVARWLIPERLRSRLDPEDLVQQTLGEVWKERARLAGLSDQQVRAYLLRALRNNAIDAINASRRVPDEVAADVFADSAQSLADWVEAEHTSPSVRAGDESARTGSV